MKKIFASLLLLVFVLFSSTGCVSTIYSAAVDERDVGTIASDTGIELEILKKLGDKESSDIIDVSVTSYNGKVFMVGEYANTQQKERFLKAAQNVEGVKSVDSYLIKEDKNHPCGTSKNLEITANVKGTLISDDSIWSTNVNISTIKCEVILWGTVGSKEEVTKSIQHAKSVEDVISVKSFLEYKK